MKIEHIAMYVNDLEGAKEFFKNTSMPCLTSCTTTKRPASVPIS